MPKSWIRTTGSTTSTGGNPPSSKGTKGEPESVRVAYDSRQGGGK